LGRWSRRRLGRGASSAAIVSPKGGRRAKVGFGDGFALPSGARAIFPTLRDVPALPIGSFRAEASAGAPAVYLGSIGHQHKFRITGGAPILTRAKISASPRLGGISGRW
jgi:hypothetical protein